MNTETTPQVAPVAKINPADIKRQVFQAPITEKSLSVLELAVNAYTTADLPVEYNFDIEKEIPDNCSIAIVPITESIESGGRVPSGLLVASVPAIQDVLGDAAGAVWAVKKLTDLMINQVKAGLGKLVESAEQLPHSIADFVSTGKSSEYAGYNAVAMDYIKALKKKSAALGFVSKVLLRQILASKQFAEHQFPRIAQSNWEFIIDAMIKSSAQQGLEPGILAYWRKTRDNALVDEIDVDLQDIGALVATQEAAAKKAEAEQARAVAERLEAVRNEQAG